jgi:hypothetical protein
MAADVRIEIKSYEVVNPSINDQIGLVIFQVFSKPTENTGR